MAPDRTTPTGSCRRAGLPGTAMPCSRPICRDTAARTGRRWKRSPTWRSGSAALMDAANVKRAGLVGHSMGGAIAVEAAAALPDRISRIALLGTALSMPVNEALLTAARDAPEQAHQMITGWALGPARQDRQQPGARPLDVRRLDGAARTQPARHAPRRLRCLQPLEIRTGGRPARALSGARHDRRQRLHDAAQDRPRARRTKLPAAAP